MLSNVRGAAVFGFMLAALPGVAQEQSRAEEYKLGPDSERKADVPKGLVLKQAFNAGPNSVFPGTERDYWVYVPKQYDGSKPAALMVFQDGGGYVGEGGQWRVPVVFDNLIANGQMPVTIGVFINPGVVPSSSGTNALPRYNRSYEYDGLGDRYARFLINELLPEVQKTYLITPDPEGHAIAGASSGAIAAFTAAWERPDYFRRVFSTIGTYVGLRGGNDYPTLVRKFEPKPLRVFLQDGFNDQNIYGGNWWIANQDVFSALQFAGYEVEKVWGMGGHDGKQGGAIFPDAMRWLWKGYPGATIQRGNGEKHLAAQLVDGDWELVGRGYQLPAGLCANDKGEVFFTDAPENRIYRIGLDGSVKLLRSDTSGAAAMVMAPDGALIATQPGAKRLVALEGENGEKFITTEVSAKELTVSHQGVTYFTEPRTRSVKSLGKDGKVTTLDTGIEFPAAVCLSPDQTLLYVSDLLGQFVYSFQIQADGTLAYKQPYYHLHLPDDPRGAGADGMCVDTDGRLYVATELGVQFCDQAGRVNGILGKPEPGAWASDVCFGGKDGDELFLAAGDKVWKRRLKAKGAQPYAAPVRPASPRL